VFGRLLDAADAFVVNMGYSVLRDRGVDDMVEAAVDSGLVVVQMPALGATGPYRTMPGYGTLMEGMGGLSARMGYLDEGARVTTTYYPDAVAGLHATVAVLAGLAGREATGEGTFIDLSQQEAVWLQLGEGIVLRAMEGREPDRLGIAEPGCALSGVYPASAGWVAVVAATDDDVATLAVLTGAETAHAEKALAAWLAGREPRQAAAELRWVGVAAEAVVTYQGADDDGVLEARGLVDELDHPVTGRRRYLSLPVRVDGRPLSSRRAAPTFATHTDEVLTDWLSMSSDELQALTDRGVVGTAPVYRARPPAANLRQ
jgi:crotonobetainyl-CoA:carnitine CoA-transferase CaiB-like acyl-CoA transferase